MKYSEFVLRIRKFCHLHLFLSNWYLPLTENEKDPVPNLPQNVTDICKKEKKLLDKILDFQLSYQAIRAKLKKLTKKDTYPTEEMSNLFQCIAGLWDALQNLHAFLKRIKSGELDPKDDDVLTELGDLIGNVNSSVFCLCN